MLWKTSVKRSVLTIYLPTAPYNQIWFSISCLIPPTSDRQETLGSFLPPPLIICSPREPSVDPPSTIARPIRLSYAIRVKEKYTEQTQTNLRKNHERFGYSNSIVRGSAHA